MSNYDDDAVSTRQKLNSISPSMCMAKWLQVSLHLPQGRTHSWLSSTYTCYSVRRIEKRCGCITQYNIQDARA